MGGLSVVCLFVKNSENGEPPAILQCNISGEYLSYFFNSWKDAIHFLSWTKKTNQEPREYDIYDMWKETFMDEEEFIGDYNQFRTLKDEYGWFLTNRIYINSSDDLQNISIWTIPEKK